MKAFTYLATAVLALGLTNMPALAQTQQDEQQPAQTQPDAQPSAQSQSTQAAAPSADQMQAFTGKIVKTSNGLVLQDQAANTTYKLDNQTQIKKFAGKNVKVTGTFDSTSNMIHVSNIELASKAY